jgi:hypothetical protein
MFETIKDIQNTYCHKNLKHYWQDIGQTSGKIRWQGTNMGVTNTKEKVAEMKTPRPSVALTQKKSSSGM